MAPGGGQQPTILPPIHSFNMEQRTPTGSCARRGSFCPDRRPHRRPTGNRPNTTRKQPTTAGQPETGRTPSGSSRPSQANREPAEHCPEAADHRRPTAGRPTSRRNPGPRTGLHLPPLLLHSPFAPRFTPRFTPPPFCPRHARPPGTGKPAVDKKEISY